MSLYTNLSKMLKVNLHKTILHVDVDKMNGFSLTNVKTVNTEAVDARINNIRYTRIFCNNIFEKDNTVFRQGDVLHFYEYAQ